MEKQDSKIKKMLCGSIIQSTMSSTTLNVDVQPYLLGEVTMVVVVMMMMMIACSPCCDVSCMHGVCSEYDACLSIYLYRTKKYVCMD